MHKHFDREIKFLSSVVDYYRGFIDAIDHSLMYLGLADGDVPILNKKKQEAQEDLDLYRDRLHLLKKSRNNTKKGKKSGSRKQRNCAM